MPTIPSTSAVPRRLMLVTSVAALLLTPGARAANKTWDGGGPDSNWLTGANWDLDSVPAGNDALFFAGANRLTPFNNFSAATAFNGVTFSAGAGAFQLMGNAVTLTTGSDANNGTVSGGTVTNNSTNPETLALPVTLAAGKHTFTTGAGSGALVLSGAFTRGANATAVFTVGGGAVNFAGSGLANDAGGILGGWAFLGNDWAALDGSGNVVAYAGYTPIAAGAITSGANLNYKYSSETGNLTAADGTAIHTLLATITAARTVTITGTLRLAAGGGVYRTGASTANSVLTVTGGFLTAGGGGEITLADATTSAANFAATNNNLRVDSVIADDGANPVSVNVMGYLDSRGANTYTGGTFINQGRVQAGNLNSLGATGSNVTVYPGGQAFLNVNGSFNYHWFLNGVGTTESNGLGAIRLQGRTVAGSITLQTTSALGGAGNVTASITGPGGLIVGNGNNANGSGSIHFGDGTGTQAYAYQGDTLINNSTLAAAVNTFFVTAGSHNLMAHGSNAGNVVLNGTGTNPSAILDLDGTTQTINGLSSTGTVANTSVVGGSGAVLTLGDRNATANFGGVIGTALSLAKMGSGTQTLSGINTYTGVTDINNGTLSVTGSLSAAGNVNVNTSLDAAGTLSGTGSVGNVTVAASGGSFVARLAPGATSAVGSVGTLTMAGLTVNGGDLAVDLPGTNDALSISGTASFAAASTITPAANAASGTYTILTAGTLSLGVAPTVVQPADSRKTFVLDTSIPNTLAIMVSGSSKILDWTGLHGGAWDLNTTTNWFDGAINDKYFNGDTVNFGDGPTNRVVTISGITVTPGAVNVNNSAGNDYSVTGTGAIGGATALVKSGAGKFTLGTNNTYTGTTSITNGTLQIGSGGTSGSLGTGAVTTDGTLAFNRSDNVTVTNAIGGGGGVTQAGNGILTLSGANTYTGATTINAGTVKVTASNSLGASPGQGVTIASGATLDLSGNVTANNLNFGQKVFTIAGTGVGGSGAIVNNSAVNQQNAFQRVVLSGDASFGGTGRFDVRAAQVGGVNQASLDLAGHTLTKNGTFFLSLVATDVTDGNIVASGGTLNLESTTSVPDFGTGTKITYNAGVSAQFFATMSPSPILRPMQFNGDGILIGNSSPGTSEVGSPMTLNGDVTLTALVVAAPGALTLKGNISEMGGAHAVMKTGTCTVVLSGNNSYSGGTTISAGTLQAGSATALGAATAPLTVNTGGTLDLGGNDITVGTLSGSGGTITSNGGAAVRLTAGGAVDSTFAGVIQNGAAVSVGLTKQGAGTLTLSGANPYTGDTLLTAGTLVVTGSINAGLSGSVSVNGGTLSGTGTTGPVVVQAGTVNPGLPGTPGVLNTGDFLLSGGTLAFDLGGSTAGNGAGFYDQLNVTNAISFNAPVSLALNFSTFDPADGVDSFTILSNDGVDPVTFFDSNARLYYGATRLNEGTQFIAVSSSIAQAFSISYAGGDGNDVVLSAVVPEPAAVFALLGGFGVLAASRRRGRRIS